jgi:DNA-binding MarR family transcriptional regulator
MHQSISIELANQLHEALLLIQRRNRRVREDFPSPLPTVDAICLSLVMHDDYLSPADLSAKLLLSSSKVSRLIAALTEKKLLRASQRLNDRRSKTLLFTERGRAVAQEIEEINRKVMYTVFDTSTQAELKDATLALRKLADGMTAFRLPEQGILSELKRITAALGILSGNYADTKIPLYRYQILFELFRKERACEFSELAKDFPLSNSTLSREIDVLVSDGLLDKQSSLNDKRSIVLSLTSGGREVFSRHHEEIARRFASYIPAAFRDVCERGIAALKKASMPALAHKRPPARVVLCACTNEEEIAAARTFLVEELVRQNEHRTLGNTIINPQHSCAVLRTGRSIIGFVEYQSGTAHTLILSRVVWSPMVAVDAVNQALLQLPRSVSGAPQDLKKLAIFPKGERASLLALLKKRKA